MKQDEPSHRQKVQNEERYNRLVAEVEDYAIILLDINGNILNWNRGAEKIKGYNEPEIIGSNFRKFYTPEDLATDLPGRLLKRAHDEGRAAQEGWRLRKDGTRFWGSISITALHNDSNDVIGYSKVTRDLTERKIAEEQIAAYTEELRQRNEQLLESEERYHRMVDEVEDYAILLLDTDGHIQNWNAGAQKIKQYTAAEAIGRHFSMFYSEEDKNTQLPKRLIGEAAEKGKALSEGWRVRKDGSKFWASLVITALHDAEGNVIGFSKVTRDLTERKSAEDKLIEYTRDLESKNKELEQFSFVASHDLQEPLRKIQTYSDLVLASLGDEMLVKQYSEKINVSARRMRDLIKATLNYSAVMRAEIEVTQVDLDAVIKQVIADMDLLIQIKKGVVLSQPLPVVTGSAIQLQQVFVNLISNALKFSNKAVARVEIFYKVVPLAEVKDKPVHFTASQYHEIEVRDNGIGFEEEYEKKIFEIFHRLHGKQEYEGTGIGLALCKKIIDNHHGHIVARGRLGDGASFFVYLEK